jgi:Helix-turn-helix domain
MAPVAPHEQLMRARTARAETVEALSARTGLRIDHVRAIEAGRFGDLPPGIYGRAAVRSFAAAYGLDADAVLAGCEPLLQKLADPIGAMARLRGVGSSHEPAADAPVPAASPGEPRWRPFAAASVDGSIAGALLSMTAGGAALLARVSIAALSRSAVSLFLVGLVLGIAYFVWLGGLGGTTFGEYAVGPEPRRRDPRPLTLRAIALRTLAAATADARAIHQAGVWVGRRLTPAGAAHNGPPPALSLSPPPPHGPEEVLTWSMSRRASVPPPPLRPRRG